MAWVKAKAVLAMWAVSGAVAQSSVVINDNIASLAPLINFYKLKSKTAPNVLRLEAGTPQEVKTQLKALVGEGEVLAFEVPVGAELDSSWVANGQVASFQPETLRLPRQVTLALRNKANSYAVPVAVHRHNVVWYNPKQLKTWKVSAPTSWNELMTACSKIRKQGVVSPLALGPDSQLALWNQIAISTLGAQTYTDVWVGKVPVTATKPVWSLYDKVVRSCTTKATRTLEGSAALEALQEGTAAFAFAGDWAHAYYQSQKLELGKDYSWALTPNTQDVFLAELVGLAVPKALEGAQAQKFANIVGSKGAVDQLNVATAGISPRLDADIYLYDSYGRASHKAWRNATVVWSMASGNAAPLSFVHHLNQVVLEFTNNKNLDQALGAMAEAAKKANLN